MSQLIVGHDGQYYYAAPPMVGAHYLPAVGLPRTALRRARRQGRGRGGRGGGRPAPSALAPAAPGLVPAVSMERTATEAQMDAMREEIAQLQALRGLTSQREAAEQALLAARYSGQAVTVPGAGGLAASEQRVKGLALGSVTAAPGGVGELRTTIQKPIQPEEIVLSSPTSLDDWEITALIVGAENQLVNSGSFPASSFQADSLRSQLQMTPGGAGVDFIIGVRNVGAVNSSIRGIVFGPAAL